MNTALLLASIAMIMSSSADASVLRTRVYRVAPNPKAPSQLTVYAMDGRIYDADATLSDELSQLENNGLAAELTIEDDVRISSVAAIPQADQATYTDEMLDSQLSSFSETLDGVDKLVSPIPASYSPTIFRTRAEVDSAWNSLYRGTHNSSQCFQRANYWAFNLYLFAGIRSMKAFIFFSHVYRTLDPDKPEEYARLGYRLMRGGAPDHRWWFHVAPLVYIQEEGQPEPTELVLDAGFPDTLNAPSELRNWTNRFVDTHKACPVITNFSVWKADDDEYLRDDEAYERLGSMRRREHCWVRIVPMYLYEPRQIERLDMHREEKNEWFQSDLRDMECAVQRPFRRC